MYTPNRGMHKSIFSDLAKEPILIGGKNVSTSQILSPFYRSLKKPPAPIIVKFQKTLKNGNICIILGLRTKRRPKRKLFSE